MLTSFSLLIGGRILNDEDRDGGELGLLFICKSSKISVSWSLALSLSLSFLSSLEIFFFSSDNPFSFCLASALSSILGFITLSIFSLLSSDLTSSGVREGLSLSSFRGEFPAPLLLLSLAWFPWVFSSAGLTSVFGLILTLSLNQTKF